MLYFSEQFICSKHLRASISCPSEATSASNGESRLREQRVESVTQSQGMMREMERRQPLRERECESQMCEQ